MRYPDILQMAFRNLKRRKARSFLTILGVIIGTASIVVMISLGVGLSETWTGQMEKWGNLREIQIYSGMRYDNEGNPVGQGKKLNDEAVDELSSLEGVSGVMPGYRLSSEARSGKREGYLEVVGVPVSQMTVFDFETAEGRLLTEGDRLQMLLGSETGRSLYDPVKMQAEMEALEKGGVVEYHEKENDTAELLGQRITLSVRREEDGREKKYSFTAVGVLSEENRDKAYSVYIPLEQLRGMKEYSVGGFSRMVSPREKDSMDRDPSDYDFMWVRADDIAAAKTLSEEIRNLGYQAYSMADSLKEMEQGTRIFQAILGGIGSVTLIVAALGIINTMVMSIYERTREIGIMKVIGASFLDIRLLFLTEAALIGLAGGVLGLVLSCGASALLNYLGSSFAAMGGEDVVISVIPVWLSLFALGFSILIGVLAGIYPAGRAVRLSPVNAMRNE